MIFCAKKKMSNWNDLDKDRTLVLCMDKLIICTKFPKNY